MHSIGAQARLQRSQYASAELSPASFSPQTLCIDP
jgi:hypothetical protein